MKYEKGQRVKIVVSYHTYSTYGSMTLTLDIEKTKPLNAFMGGCSKPQIGTIVGMADHPNKNIKLYKIEIDNIGCSIIMEESGFESISTAVDHEEMNARNCVIASIVNLPYYVNENDIFSTLELIHTPVTTRDKVVYVGTSWVELKHVLQGILIALNN